MLTGDFGLVGYTAALLDRYVRWFQKRRAPVPVSKLLRCYIFLVHKDYEGRRHEIIGAGPQFPGAGVPLGQEGPYVYRMFGV
jgi:hypothetical protein